MRRLHIGSAPSVMLRKKRNGTLHTQKEPSTEDRKVLQSKTRSGRLVTLGTASLKEKPFASREKVQETLAKANAASREIIRKHRAELLGKD